MKRSPHQELWLALLALLAVIACLTPYLWQKFYYDGPTSAFYELATALEQNDKAKLAELTGDDTEARIYELAKSYGGISELGRELKRSSRVRPAIHMVPQWMSLQKSKMAQLCSCSRDDKCNGWP